MEEVSSRGSSGFQDFLSCVDNSKKNASQDNKPFVRSSNSSEDLSVIATNIEDRITTVVTDTQNLYDKPKTKIEIKAFIWSICNLFGSILKTSAIIGTVYHLLYFAITLGKYLISGGSSSNFLFPLFIALGLTACVLAIVLLKAAISYKQKQLNKEEDLLSCKLIAIDMLYNILLKVKDYENCGVSNETIEKIIKDFNLHDKLSKLFYETMLAIKADIHEYSIEGMLCYTVNKDQDGKNIKIESTMATKRLHDLSVVSEEFFIELFKSMGFKEEDLKQKAQEIRESYVNEIIKSDSNDITIDVIKRSIIIGMENILERPQGSQILADTVLDQ